MLRSKSGFLTFPGLIQIFVSIQYRLLFYGFPSGDEPHDLGIENLGLLDQRLAFKWVKENIGAFGGDGDKVTIMGESAGGTGILQHLVAYGGRDDNLFRAGKFGENLLIYAIEY